MKYLVSLAIAAMVLVGMPAQASNAAPDGQWIIPYYSEWSAPLYEPYYAPVYYRPFRSYRVPYTVWCRYC